MPDLFDDLQHQLTDLPTPVPGLPAVEVRRRGDRLRRRRVGLQAVGAAAAVAVVASGGALLVHPGAGSTPVAPAAQSPNPVPSLPTPAPVGTLLTSQGYGDVRLGMHAAALARTGVRLDPDSGGPCRAGRLAHGVGTVYLSKRYGVVAIFLDGRQRTEAGIGVGSTLEDVRAAYPAARRDGARHDWTLPQGPGRQLRITTVAGRVEVASLVADEQNCFG